MNDLYQLRKDIDDLYSRFFDLDTGELTVASKEELDKLIEKLRADNSLEVLETNLSSFSKDLDDYAESLESFGGQLEDYSGSLEDFSGQLSDYGDSLDGFSGQLSDYGDSLDGFSGQLSDYGDTLDGFSSDLSDYSDRLGDLDDALNDESDGFIVSLSVLKNYIYGYDPNNPSITYQNPSSDSLKGMTNELQQLLHDLSTGDGIVLENLGRLKDHINAFTGTLQQFKTYLTQQGVDVSTLDDAVLSLILELNKSLDVISDHQDLIEETQEIIGEPSTQSTQATGMFKRLEDGEEIIDNVSQQADAIDVIVNGDPSVPSDTGLVGATSSLESTVGNSSSGLVKETNALKNTVGNSSSGLVKETNTLKNTVGNSDSGLVKETNALKTTVGNSSSGLVKQTNDLRADVGDENSGLIAQTNDIVDTIGEPASQGQSATGLHLAIDNAQDTADAVSGVANLIKGKIGYDQIGSTNLQSQITNQGNQIGTVPTGKTLQGQITSHTNQIGTVPSGKTLQGQITTIEDNAPIIITDFYLSDSIVGIATRKNKSLWNKNSELWVVFKLMKNGVSYTPSSTEFPIVIFTPSGQSSTIYRYASRTFGEVYTYSFSEVGLHLLVIDGKTYPILVEDFSSYTLTSSDKADYVSNFSTCDVTFNKQGHMVTCVYHINTVTFANRNDHTLTTSIPTAYRPSNWFYQDICTYGGQKLDGLITVGTDGSMKIRMGTANTSMNVYGSFTYIV